MGATKPTNAAEQAANDPPRQPVNTPELAKHIRATRIEKGWTLCELARLCQLSIPTIHKAENGGAITVTTRKRIIAIVGQPHVGRKESPTGGDERS